MRTARAQVGREVLEPSSAPLQAAPLNRLSYQPNKKSPTSLLTPGLLPFTGIGAECHKRKGYRGCKLALDAQLPADMRSWIELSHLNIIAIVPSTRPLLRPTRRY